MFGMPGTAYVYGIYGMHTCLNVVTGPRGTPAAVLIRAVEPVSGLGLMRAARLARAIATRRADRAAPEAAARRIALLADADLTAGPGSLGAAFDIDPADDGRDLLDPRGPLRLEPALPDDLPPLVLATPRIGVARAGPEWAARPWRFVARRPGRRDGAR
jgi:DNA-3-methyladenine glycosylase